MLQPRLKNVTPMEQYRLRLEYETGEVKLLDVAPYISGAWYEELKDAAYFKTVHLLPDGVGIKWSNGQDIAPHELYECSIPA